MRLILGASRQRSANVVVLHVLAVTVIGYYRSTMVGVTGVKVSYGQVTAGHQSAMLVWRIPLMVAGYGRPHARRYT